MKPKKELPSKPICPLCKTEMHVIKYEGYYDSHVVWTCNCDDKVLEDYVTGEWQGQYV